MKRRELNGCRAVLTGASSGIGWQLALELARQGVSLIVTARRSDRLRALAELVGQLGVSCETIAGDLTQPDVRQAIRTTVTEHWGALDLCINCAGVGAMGPFLEASPERVQRVFDVNFFAPVELIRLLAPLMKDGCDPLIVNVGSVLGHRAVPFKSEYCASKFALHGFSDALRCELAPSGIGVLLVSPSTTDSEFFEAVLEDRIQRDWKGARPMPAERVARLTVRAIRQRKHEIILSLGGCALVWLDRLAPRLADYLVTRWAQ